MPRLWSLLRGWKVLTFSQDLKCIPSSVNGLVAGIGSIDLSWDIDVRFGDLMWCCRSRYYCPWYGLRISGVQFLPHNFVCSHFILCSLDACASYLFHIFPDFPCHFTIPVLSPICYKPFLFFYLNVFFATSSTVSYFSCLFPILSSL